MDVEVRLQSTDLAEVLHAYVERRLRFSLGRLAGRLGRVKVRIVDSSGPRGGVDKSCRIATELLSSGKPVIKEAVDVNLYAAIDHATSALAARLAAEMAGATGRRPVRP